MIKYYIPESAEEVIEKTQHEVDIFVLYVPDDADFADNFFDNFAKRFKKEIGIEYIYVDLEDVEDEAIFKSLEFIKKISDLKISLAKHHCVYPHKLDFDFFYYND